MPSLGLGIAAAAPRHGEASVAHGLTRSGASGGELAKRACPALGDPAIPVEQPALASPQPLPLPDKPSIAVLPFQNMSGDPEQEYFADGMVEEIITALSRIRWLFVIAPIRVSPIRGKPSM